MQAVKRLFVFVALISAPVWAVPPASVDAVQMPAWIDRDGRTRPLVTGMDVAHGDVVRTGEGGRAWLKLAEGSTVKLGENAQLAVFSRSLEPRTAFRGALDLRAGALRFTTDPARRVKSREIAIRFGAATADIRETDLWGHSTVIEDLVCLVEGTMGFRHGALPEAVPMAVPMSFIAVPRDGTPKPVGLAKMHEFRTWARQTEIEPGDGAVRKDGRWVLRLGRHAARDEALAQYDAARHAGFAANIKPSRTEVGWIYDVVLPGFVDAADAESAASRLKSATGIAAAVAPGR